MWFLLFPADTNNSHDPDDPKTDATHDSDVADDPDNGHSHHRTLSADLPQLRGGVWSTRVLLRVEHGEIVQYPTDLM